MYVQIICGLPQPKSLIPSFIIFIFKTLNWQHSHLKGQIAYPKAITFTT